jgi:endonuclease YncB( thermonuclease family)
MGWRGRAAATAIVAVFAVISAFFGAVAEERSLPDAAAMACGGDEVARGTVSRVLDGRTFLLDDGREVRLAAIEVPPIPPPPVAEQPGAAAGGMSSKGALAQLLAGAQVVLRRAEFPSDRYGRIMAYAIAVRGDSQVSTQAELISKGFARVGDRIGSRDCAAELLRGESSARAARLGLWAKSSYIPLQADRPEDILAQRGRFALVEGSVVSVHESGATVYVNFGRHWSEDFSVTIRKRNEASFTAANLDLKRFVGRRLMVRGWIEARGGMSGSPWRAPWIEAVYPEQIETADRN